jgi:methionyl aminopeptidase
MVHLKTAEEIQFIRESATILAQTHGEVARLIKPGVKTKKLDEKAEEFIRDNQGIPSFLNYNGFPASLCISVNETVVHGFPSEYELKEGDIVTIDCGVKFKGYHSDAAYTYPLEGVKAEVLDLLNRTYDSLYLGIDAAKTGNRIGDVSYAVQSCVESARRSGGSQLRQEGKGTQDCSRHGLRDRADDQPGYQECSPGE